MDGLLDGAVDERLIGQDFFPFHGPGSGDDEFRLGVINTDCQLMGGESAENQRMNHPQTGAGQHGDCSLGDHRHVDDDGIALHQTLTLQHPGKGGYPRLQLFIGYLGDGIGDRTVIDNRSLIGTTIFDMTIDSIVAGIHFSPGKPAIKWRI